MAFEFCCVRCNFTCKQEPRFNLHLLNFHYIDPAEELVIIKYGGIHPVCACGCNEKIVLKGWKQDNLPKFIRGHNTRIETTFSNPDMIEKMKETRNASRQSGKWKVWNSGLTKETCESLDAAAKKKSNTMRTKYSSGEITSWQQGKTKETSISLRKMSETKIHRFSTGESIAWNEGLTKTTSKSLMLMSEKISESYKKREAGKRLSVNEVRSRLEKFNFDIIDDNYTDRKTWGLTVVHKTCGTIQLRSLYSLETGMCVSCDKMSSTGQRDLENFVRSLGVEIVSSTRNIIPPSEIDVWIPSKKFAIEFNGLYWHSEKFRDKNYHNEKTTAVKNAGGTLLHIFEDEWRDNQEIIKSMIRARLGLIDNIIGARKCSIKELTQDERRCFFTNSHIDGDVRAIKSWGLIYNENIVAAISVRNSMHKKWESSLEIARFAVAQNTYVVGALGKLIKCVIEFAQKMEKNSLLSYADERYGTGASYEIVGFKLHERTSPRFWWTNGTSRIDRFSVRANSSMGMTQKEVATKSGVIKIWGNSNAVYTLDISSKI